MLQSVLFRSHLEARFVVRIYSGLKTLLFLALDVSAVIVADVIVMCLCHSCVAFS